MVSGYGYLRAAWNMNPSPYVSRFEFNFSSDGVPITFPTCASHYDILQFDDMMDFFYNMAGGPHADAHAVLGGYYGCDTFNKMLEKGYIVSISALYNLCAGWFSTLQDLWRNNYISPHTNCTIDSEDIQRSSCGFECISVDLAVEGMYVNNANYVDSSIEGANETWADFICNGDAAKIFTADHMEGVSTTDPTF
jgi:hypothetical protein